MIYLFYKERTHINIKYDKFLAQSQSEFEILCMF